jgi:hypothetical protein
MRVDIAWQFDILTNLSPDEVRGHAEEVMKELLELEECAPVCDSAVSLDLSEPSITLEVGAYGDDCESALSEALSAIRAAIHAAGGSIPNWHEAFRLEPADLQAQPA